MFLRMGIQCHCESMNDKVKIVVKLRHNVLFCNKEAKLSQTEPPGVRGLHMGKMRGNFATWYDRVMYQERRLFVIFLADLQLDTRYDTTVEFTVDWKDECLKLSLAHMARKKYIKEESKTNKRQTNASVICNRSIFSARQHSMCLARYMQSPVRPSVCLSVTWVDDGSYKNGWS